MIDRGTNFSGIGLLHGEVMCSNGLLHPVGADDGGDSQGRASRDGSQEAEPQPKQTELKHEGEKETQRQADQVEGTQVDARADGGACTASKNSTGNSLWEVPKLAETHDGEDLCDAAKDLGVVGEEPPPNEALTDEADRSKTPQSCAQAQRSYGGMVSPERPIRPQLVPNSRADAR